MTTIISNWRQYFTDYDEGLGTTYERFILHQYFDEIMYEVTLDLLQAIETNELSSISQASQVYDQIVLDRIYIETVVQFMEEFDIKKYDSIMDELRKDFIKRWLAIYKE